MELFLLLFGFFMWGIALVFFILTLKFRSWKFRKWIFGSIALIFVILPFLILRSVESKQNNQKLLHKTQKDKYSGVYVCDCIKANKFILNLRNDDTFTFTMDGCDAGSL